MKYRISSLCLTKLFTFSRLILNGIFPGTEIGFFFKIVLFNIVFFNVVFFNVASTKSSNIAGILSFGGLLGLIRKRLVEFRLDFLAFPSLVDIPPVFGLCSRRARPCCFWFFGYRKWPPSVSFGFDRFFIPAAPCIVSLQRHLVHVEYDG